MNCGCDEMPDNVILNSIAFASKSLPRADWQYSSIECKTLGILHGLEKFYHYCFAKEVYVITDHKSLVVIVSKEVAKLSQCLHHIILCIHQFSACISYKPGPDLYILGWLSWNNHTENKDQEITGMNIKVHAISTEVDILICHP